MQCMSVLLQGALRKWRGTICYCLLGQAVLCCRLLSHGMDQHDCSLPTLTWLAKPVTMSAEKAVDHSRHKRWEDEVGLSCSSPATVLCGLAQWVPSKSTTEPSPACAMTTRVETFTNQWQAAHSYLFLLKHMMESILSSYFLYKLFC